MERKQERLLPKRPTAPYTLFQIEERRRDPTHYNKLSLELSAKEISMKWKALDKAAKAKYMKIFTAQKKNYDKAKKNIKLKLIQGAKLKCEKNKVHQPFVAFIKENYNLIKGSSTNLVHKEIMKKLSEKWKLLNLEEKGRYRLMLNSVAVEKIK